MKKLTKDFFIELIGNITVDFDINSNANMEMKFIPKISRPTIVDFYSETCNPCRLMMPVVEDLEKEFGEKIDFYKVDVDESYEVADYFNIVGLPTIILFHPEKERIQLAGLRTKEKLRGNIKKYFGFGE
jgi:thioredoxin 1